MNNKHMTRAVSLLLLLALIISVFPLSVLAGAATAAETEETETTEPEPPAETSEQEPKASEEPSASAAETEALFSREEPVTEAPSVEEPISEEDMVSALAWMDSGLLLLKDGTFVLYDPTNDDLGEDVNSRGNQAGLMAIPTGIYYSDVLGAHGSDLNGYYIKSGGLYDSWVYGNNQWWPYSTGVLSPNTNKRVYTTMMYCNDGPIHYKTESGVLAIPIRPSQESGWSMDVNGYGNYTTRSTGVPTFKSESLYTKMIPTYTAATWTQISLIYGVAKGMGGMTESGNTNVTAAASTLITNVVFGYIGLGSDKVFHGKPIMTSSSAVNTQMLEILVRCEVYSKEKGVTGSTTGDNTVAAIKAKGYSATDTTGWYVKSGTASSRAMAYFQINKSQSSGNQVYIYGTNEITFDSGKTISLKKTIKGSASAQACMEGNPLYSLQGAVYEIHQGSATGPVVETLTTNANGEATGTRKYEINTKLYAVEVTAPAGYELDPTPVELTIDSGTNVFNVEDKPTFDPNSLVLTKTDEDSERITGAVFKVQFYGSNWADSTKLLKTWYFQSKADGTVKLLDSYLATGYTSDPLYKLNGREVLPLGCAVVTEVKTASGYVLPTGNNASVFIFIRQGGGKTIQPGAKAGAYWGNGSADPLNPSNPKGIYKVENDANKDNVSAVNPKAYGKPFSVQKIDPSNVPLEGAVFKVDYYNAGWFDATKLERTWYFKTDSNGYFTLDSAHLASGYTSDALFPTNKIPVGIMRVQEIKAPTGFQLVSFIGVWRMKQTGSGSSTVDSYWAAANGDTPTTSYGDVAYVLDADPAKLYVSNEPIPGTMELQKIADNGDVKDYCFKLYQWSVNKSWYGKTDNDGKLYVTNESYSASGTKVYTFQGLTDGTYTLLEVLSLHGKDNVWPESIRITVKNNGTTKYDHTFTGSDFSEDSNGDCRLDRIAITGLSGGGTMSITVKNKPITFPLEIIKTSEDGVVNGISFKVEQYESGVGWWTKGTYQTDASGKILMDPLPVGTKLRITEIVPEDYICTSENPQTITLSEISRQVSFTNKPIASLEIVKHSDDGNIAGISFLVEQYEPTGGIGWWERGTYVTDNDGKIDIADLDVGVKLRITEIVPENYTADQRVQEITTRKGLNTVSFQNHPIVELELFKTSEDDNVAGIEFTLEKQDGTVWSEIGTYVTDEDGSIFVPELELGAIYRITETVPEGYVGEQPVQEFTAQLGTNTVRFSNRLIRGNLLIVKLDRGTKTPLQGAGFVVLNEDGEEVAREYTNEQGEIYIEGLPYGQYTYREFEAPEGFALDETAYPFSILEDGETIVEERENDIIPGSIPIYKVDEDNRPLPGVTFLLEYSADNGSTWAPGFYREPDSAVIAGGCTSEGLNNGKLTTGSDGKAEFTGLCIDTQLGKVLYRLTEVSTKPGYNLLTEPAFEGSLPLDGQTEVSLTIVNTPTFKMPATGGGGFAATVSAMSITGIALAVLLYALTGKKRKSH